MDTKPNDPWGTASESDEDNNVDSDQATEYVSASSHHDSDTDEELNREREQIAKYLRENPFTLTYHQLNQKMEAAARDMPQFAQSIMVWSAELGEWNFEQLKVIRENIMDLNKTKEIGELIHKRGGMQALTGNFYILKNFMCEEPPLRWQCTDIIFHGVGEWRH